MTNLAEAIQNACEIARQDERRKFKEYLENKIKTVDSANYDSHWELLNEIINELFGGE